MFRFLNPHQNVWFIKWSEKDEKVLKDLISICLCDVTNIPKFIF